MNAQLQPTGSAYFIAKDEASPEKHTLSVLVDNEPGVLARVIGLFSGRGYNIESLTVSETEHETHLSRITIVTSGTPHVLEQIKHQLERIVPVHRVVDLTVRSHELGQERPLERELALVKVAGKALLDWGLDSLKQAGVGKAVVNVHYFPKQIVAHVAGRAAPKVVVSDESDLLLDSAGGIVRALPELGEKPFYVLNADTFWIDRGTPNLTRLALAWDGAKMDILLMLADIASATGHSGGTDFLVGADGALRRAHNDPAGLIYAGAAIVHPRIFAGAPAGPLSLNRYFDDAIARSRLFGMKMQGRWITVGTPEAIPLAERAVAQAFAATP